MYACVELVDLQLMIVILKYMFQIFFSSFTFYKLLAVISPNLRLLDIPFICIYIYIMKNVTRGVLYNTNSFINIPYNTNHMSLSYVKTKICFVFITYEKIRFYLYPSKL